MSQIDQEALERIVELESEIQELIQERDHIYAKWKEAEGQLAALLGFYQRKLQDADFSELLE